MEGVGAHAVADDLGEDVGAAGLGELELFEDEDAGAFADDKAVAVLVEGAGGVRGVVVAGGEGLHGSEAADAHRRDGSLRAAGDHGVGVAALDDAEGVADGVRGGGAGGCGRLVRPLGAVADGDVAGGQVDDRGGDKERRDLARPAVHQVGVLALDDVEPADAGADVHADVICDFRCDLQAGVLHGLVRGCQREVDEAAHLTGLLLVHELVGIEVLNLGRKPDGMSGEVEGLNFGHATAAGHQAFPHLGCGVTDPAECAEAGDDNASLVHHYFPSGLLSVWA